MRIFGPKIFYVDHTTKVPGKKQRGTRRKPYGSLAQLAVLSVKPGTTVKVCFPSKPGKPVVDFTVPGPIDAPVREPNESNPN